MKYYIFLPGDAEENAEHSTNTLGETSFKTFYRDDGFYALMNIIQRGPPELLECVKIINDKKETVSIEDFLDILEKYQLR